MWRLCIPGGNCLRFCYLQSGDGRREAAGELAVIVDVWISEDACGSCVIHALQGSEAPDGEGADRRCISRSEVLAVRGPTAERETWSKNAGQCSWFLVMLVILIWYVPSANTGVPIQKKLFRDFMYWCMWSARLGLGLGNCAFCAFRLFFDFPICICLIMLIHHSMTSSFSDQSGFNR